MKKDEMNAITKVARIMYEQGRKSAIAELLAGLLIDKNALTIYLLKNNEFSNNQVKELYDLEDNEIEEIYNKTRDLVAALLNVKMPQAVIEKPSNIIDFPITLDIGEVMEEIGEKKEEEKTGEEKPIILSSHHKNNSNKILDFVFPIND